MLKLLGSIVGGLIIAFGLVFLADALFHSLSPRAAPPVNAGDPEAMRQYVARQPAALLAALVVAWAVAAFAGSGAAARLAGRDAWPGWVVAVLFLIATWANFMMVQHPVWMVIAATMGIATAGWYGARVGARVPRSGPALT